MVGPNGKNIGFCLSGVEVICITIIGCIDIVRIMFCRLQNSDVLPVHVVVAVGDKFDSRKERCRIPPEDMMQMRLSELVRWRNSSQQEYEPLCLGIINQTFKS